MIIGRFCKYFVIITYVIGLLMSYSCSEKENYKNTIRINDEFFKGEVIVEKIEKLDKYKVSVFNSITNKGDHIYTPYEIFQMETGDVNHDGKTDICIGIIKPTPFDSVLKKRLFIFQIDKDYIRPLWLSSRLVKPLEEFKIVDDKNNCIIKTIEKEGAELYCISEYKWESFGMKFTKVCHDSLSLSEAHGLLNK